VKTLMRVIGIGATAVAFPGLAAAQHPAAREFDIGRAWIVDSTIFVPFRVTSTTPLKEARSKGLVDDATAILVLEHGATRLALITSQMAYHHVAQGDIAGEPWMVSF
jgi:hypothetical protein